MGMEGGEFTRRMLPTFFLLLLTTGIECNTGLRQSIQRATHLHPPMLRCKTSNWAQFGLCAQLKESGNTFMPWRICIFYQIGCECRVYLANLVDCSITSLRCAGQVRKTHPHILMMTAGRMECKWSSWLLGLARFRTFCARLFFNTSTCLYC